jgi:hypothetical protein
MFVMSLSATAVAAEPGPGMAEGRLVNGTEGGTGSVASQEVILTTYLNDKEAGSSTTITDTEGHFVFDGLPNTSGYSYEVMVFYQEANYYSGSFSFDEGETTKFVEVTVYDATTSDEAIKVTMAHTVISVGPEHLQVEEYYVVVNETDRTYIGSKEPTSEGKRQTLRFSLPKEASDPQYSLDLMPCCVIGSQSGFADTMPVPPGSRELAYSYQVSHNSGKYTLSQNVEYPMLRYDLLVQGEGIEVNGNQLAPQKPVDIGGRVFQHY